jgi:hypothetical protein
LAYNNPSPPSKKDAAASSYSYRCGTRLQRDCHPENMFDTMRTQRRRKALLVMNMLQKHHTSPVEYIPQDTSAAAAHGTITMRPDLSAISCGY